MFKMMRTLKKWFTELDDHERQAKKMRREDRLGEIDYQKIQQKAEEDENEKRRSKFDA